MLNDPLEISVQVMKMETTWPSISLVS